MFRENKILAKISDVKFRENKILSKISEFTVKYPMKNKISVIWDLFIYLFDSLRPSQQFFSYVGTDLPGLNQY